MDSQRRMTDERRKVLHELAEKVRSGERQFENALVVVDCEAELTRMEQALEDSRRTAILDCIRWSHDGMSVFRKQAAFELQALTRAKGEQ